MTLRRLAAISITLCLLGMGGAFWLAAEADAQGPFPAQIQAAFQALGLWPSSYTNGQVPTYSSASGMFLPGSGGGGSVPASGVTAGTFGAGDFTFQNGVRLGSAGTVNIDTDPVTGYRIVPNPTTFSQPSDISFVAPGGYSFNVRNTINYTMLLADWGNRAMYFTAANFVLFNNFGKKTFYHASNNLMHDDFILGDDGFSSGGTGGGNYLQTLSSFDGSYILATDQVGGALRVAAGKGTGNAAPGYIIFDVPNAEASGTTRQTWVTRFKITDAAQFLDSGTRPACNVGNRFKVWVDAGGAGVADTVEICSKDAGDAYAWRTLQ